MLQKAEGDQTNIVRSVEGILFHDCSCCRWEFLKFSFTLTGGDHMYRWSLSQERCLPATPSAPLCGCSIETDTLMNTERGFQHYLYSKHVPDDIGDTKFCAFFFKPHIICALDFKLAFTFIFMHDTQTFDINLTNETAFSNGLCILCLIGICC